jgi:Flp pilus assembly protein TadG
MMRATDPRDRGAVAIIVAVFVVAAMILLAFVVDRGRIYVVRAQLQNAVDSAVLAGLQEECRSGTNPVAVATSYAASNGAPSAVVARTADSTSAYINVRATEQVQLFFGPFASADAAVVAAQATGVRLCQITYRIVANSLVNFNGQGSTSGPIYAGACFEGSNGVFPTVAVYTAATQFDPCPDNSFGSGAKTTTIYAGNNGSVGERLYSAPPLDIQTYVPSVTQVTDVAAEPDRTFASVFDAQTWINNPVNGAYTGSCKDTDTWGANQALKCTGGNPDTLNIDASHRGMVIAPNDININGLTAENGLIWSLNGDISIDATTDVTANTVLYAPNGVIRITGNGSGGDVQAVTIAQEITINGSGANLSTGVPLYGPGPYRLIQ